MVVFVGVAINVTVEIRLLSTFAFCKACLKPFPAVAPAIGELTATFINNKVPLFTLSFTAHRCMNYKLATGERVHASPFRPSRLYVLSLRLTLPGMRSANFLGR
jgi:hypothetical protein